MMHCNNLPQEESPAARRESLLEDWPRRASSKEADQDVDSSKSQSGVNFSDFSTLHVYDDLDYLYLKKKAYSQKDREVFSARAMMEAIRIKNLIFNSPPVSVKESIKYLLKNNIISRDELIGIDHLIAGRRTDALHVRRDHMAAVLRKQQELRRHQPQQEEDSLIIELGRFSEQSSLRSTHYAIARATLSSSP
mmetsp:Transcript_21514/g.32546  ORF Transcript_21514/g.32546 Transcript_21514/m.32546 type:complete len:193 (+) Transcript_21514:172-750(+)